ncbi:MAG: hypothetical protein AAGF95_11565 [Chloroflexota bacterium]
MKDVRAAVYPPKRVSLDARSVLRCLDTWATTRLTGEFGFAMVNATIFDHRCGLTIWAIGHRAPPLVQD